MRKANATSIFLLVALLLPCFAGLAYSGSPGPFHQNIRSLGMGGAGVATREWVMCAFLDNIIVSNHAGMNLYDTDANCWRNLVWGNVTDYLPRDPSEGEDIHVDPMGHCALADVLETCYRTSYTSQTVLEKDVDGVGKLTDHVTYGHFL